MVSHTAFNTPKKNPSKPQVAVFSWGLRSYENKTMRSYHKDRNSQNIIVIHNWLDEWTLEVTKQPSGFLSVIWISCLTNFTSSVLPIYSTSFWQNEKIRKKNPNISKCFMCQSSRKYRESVMSRKRELSKDGHWKLTKGRCIF